MKTSEVFKRAKAYLAVNRQEVFDRPEKQVYICLAIARTERYDRSVTDGDLTRCTAVVMSRISGFRTLESWLAAQGCISNGAPYLSRATRDRIQQHRHAWLDMLIAEFKAKGD